MVKVFTKNGEITCYKEEAENLISLGLASKEPLKKTIKEKEIK